MRQSFTAGQASAITGVPYRTLDHWARSSLIVPSIAEARGTGTERRYGFIDLIALRVAKELRTAGVSTQSLRRVIKFLRENRKLTRPLSEARLLVVGSDVMLVGDCKELISLLDKPGQCVFAFMVDMKRTVSELRDRVEKLIAA